MLEIALSATRRSTFENIWVIHNLRGLENPCVWVKRTAEKQTTSFKSLIWALVSHWTSCAARKQKQDRMTIVLGVNFYQMECLWSENFAKSGEMLRPESGTAHIQRQSNYPPLKHMFAAYMHKKAWNVSPYNFSVKRSLTSCSGFRETVAFDVAWLQFAR